MHTPEESLALYKKELKNLANWLHDVTEIYRGTCMGNQLSLAHAEFLFGDYNRNSKEYRRRVEKLKTMVETLGFTKEELLELHKEAKLRMGLEDMELFHLLPTISLAETRGEK